jgi:hypothetical protein
VPDAGGDEERWSATAVSVLGLEQESAGARPDEALQQFRDLGMKIDLPLSITVLDAMLDAAQRGGIGQRSLSTRRVRPKRQSARFPFNSRILHAGKIVCSVLFFLFLSFAMSNDLIFGVLAVPESNSRTNVETYTAGTATVRFREGMLQWMKLGAKAVSSARSAAIFDETS